MRKRVIDTLVLATMAGTIAGLLTGTQDARASKPFKEITKLKCSECHKTEDEDKMTALDLTAAGKKSALALKKPQKNDKGDTVTYEKEKERALAELARKYLKDFKP